MIRGFEPIAAQGARVLVLGTLPERQSLAAGRYYANLHNAFCFMIEELFNARPGLDYEARTALLKGAGAVPWDVRYRGPN
jgi:hypoxanthine-DNA glycosylase